MGDWKRTIPLVAGAGFGLFVYYYKFLKRNYGWIPDISDITDLFFTPDPSVEIPMTVDLSPQCSAVETQGSLGSCCSNALVSALEYLENIEKMAFIDLSRLFVYYNVRVITNTVEKDSGAQIRDGISALQTYGVCSEKNWPYIISQFKNKPSSDNYSEAAEHKIVSAERLSGLDNMLQCLSQGYPFVFGFTVYESFESTKVAQTGVLNMPGLGEKKKGGHAVLAVGFDNESKIFKVRNSYGSGWGQKGYFTMPFEYLEDPTLSGDYWVIRRY
jgi:C1A family cysteine protease